MILLWHCRSWVTTRLFRTNTRMLASNHGFLENVFDDINGCRPNSAFIKIWIIVEIKNNCTLGKNGHRTKVPRWLVIFFDNIKFTSSKLIFICENFGRARTGFVPFFSVQRIIEVSKRDPKLISRHLDRRLNLSSIKKINYLYLWTLKYVYQPK